ncbi:hypothetical protein J6590_083611 [Homalodisca vitripennis]|nr:hypothetical protein J6590_083611 [Homalodisca vitripennis]
MLSEGLTLLVEDSGSTQLDTCDELLMISEELTILVEVAVHSLTLCDELLMLSEGLTILVGAIVSVEILSSVTQHMTRVTDTFSHLSLVSLNTLDSRLFSGYLQTRLVMYI